MRLKNKKYTKLDIIFFSSLFILSLSGLVIALVLLLSKKNTTFLIDEYNTLYNEGEFIAKPVHVLRKNNLNKVHLVSGDKGSHDIALPDNVSTWEGYIEIVNHHNITDTLIIDSQHVDLRVVEYHNTLTTYNNEKTDIFGSVYAFQNKNKITMNLNNYRLKFTFHKGKIFVTGEALIISSFEVNGVEKA